MTVSELINALKALPLDSPVYIRQESLTANILLVESVNAATYSFFGLQLPCVILATDPAE